MRAHDQHNTSEVTPIKQCEQEEDKINVQQQGDYKNVSTSSAAITFPKIPNNGSVKASDIHQADEAFYSTNDPIFQSAASPNMYRDYKGHCSTYFGSTFKNNSILASTKKLYNNNLFLTPIKEDERFKPSYLNSIFKDSPHFSTNNICRRLVFDDDIDDLLGNNFMNAQNIFEEKKGVFSNFHINQLHTPQNQHHASSQVYDQTIYGANINASDFPPSVKAKQSNSGLESPENKKTQDTLQTPSQTEIQVESQKKAFNKVDLFEADDTPIKNKSQGRDQNVAEKERLGNVSNSMSTKNAINLSNSVNNNNLSKGIQLSLSSLLEKNMNEQHQTHSTTGNSLKTNNISLGLVNDTMNNNSSGSDAGAGKKQKTCNCKKTKCLKLYCDCFAAGELCNGDCNCFGCYNTSSSEKRTAAICTIMDRQPEAFGPKVQSNAHKKGCNCTRSGCLKKYCECYTLGVNCGEYCKCQQCKNVGNPPLGMKVEDARPSLEEIEEQSSTKKKLFFSSTSSSLHLNQKLSQEEDEEVEEEEEEEEEIQDKGMKEEEIEEEDDDNDKAIKDPHALSPNSSKMYTTPLKSSNKRELRSLTTADTQKKQIRLAQEQDSDLKHHIVKLTISDNNNSNLNGGTSKSTHKKKGIIAQQANSKQLGQKPANTHGLRSGGGEEIHVQLKGGIVQLQNKTKSSH